MSGESQYAYDVFISYSHADKEWVTSTLLPRLEAEGLRVCIDFRDFEPGEAIVKGMRRAVETSRKTLTVLTPAYVESAWAESEHLMLQTLDGANRKRRLIPLLKARCDLPLEIAYLTYVDFTDPNQLDVAWTKLFDALKPPRIKSTTPESSPPRSLPLDKWAVREAYDVPGFLDRLHKVYDVVKSFNPQAELVITLYARSFPGEDGVGSFEYDLLYCCNLREPAPMFGPIVQNDERIDITEDSTSIYKLDQPILRPKEGGFADREEIITRAWFKLGDGIWKREAPTPASIDTDRIKGLLFINARERTLTDSTFEAPEFKRAVADLEDAIGSVIKKRRTRFNDRRVALGRAFRRGSRVPGIARKRREDIGIDDIHKLFSDIAPRFEKISGNTDVAFTVFAYDDDRKRLTWLWSNGPTSVEAYSKLSSDGTPLPVQVALDDNHKPLLIHNLQRNSYYRDRAVITKHGSKSQANLVIPVSSINGDNQLLGVIDVQGIKESEFDADDVQLVYQLSELYISVFLEKVIWGLSERSNSVIPLRTTSPYTPFERKPLRFDIHDLLDLNFNPMKYLFHWDRIEEIILGKPVQFPSLVEIWPSMKCNHSCSWCRTRFDRLSCGTHAFMNGEALHELAHDLVRQDHVDVLISGGGEPLLHEHIHEFMAVLKDVKGTIGIFTNGTRPRNFAFWEHFFAREGRHSFVRISFNGPNPEAYFRIHFNRENGDLPSDYEKHYTEARKIVLDLLGMRSDMATVALGSTVQWKWRDKVAEQAEHAKRLNVDFIQMRPELHESAGHPKRGHDVRKKVQRQEAMYRDSERFAVKYTDGERSFKNHDYGTCYAMYLVPALVPSIEPGWITVLPCSYTQIGARKAPILGRMKEGTRLSDFWKELNSRTGRAAPSNGNADNIKDVRSASIDPRREGCPQCRYYMLNKRIEAIEGNPSGLKLMGQLVELLNRDHGNVHDLTRAFKSAWPASEEREENFVVIDRKVDEEGVVVVDFEQAARAFALSKRLDVRPSL